MTRCQGSTFLVPPFHPVQIPSMEQDILSLDQNTVVVMLEQVVVPARHTWCW